MHYQAEYKSDTVNVPISQLPISQRWPFSQRFLGILKSCEKGQMAALFATGFRK